MTGSANTTDSPSRSRVLLVEDEMLIMMLLEEIIEDLGHEIAGSAVNLKQAGDLAASVEADVAILDVNLAGDPVFPVAEQLAARAIPIIFASGYGPGGLPDHWRNYPTLPKPFTADQIDAALTKALPRVNGGG